MPVVLQFKAYVYGRFIAEIAGSNCAQGMDVRLLCCVRSGLCDGLISLSEGSYRVCLCVCMSHCM